MKTISILTIIGVVMVIFAITFGGFLYFGDRFPKILLIFGAIFLPTIFFIRLIIGIIMALKGNKQRDRK